MPISDTSSEWRRVCVPGASCGLQPLDQLRRVGRRLSSQCTASHDALDGLGHVEPGTAEGRVQRHDAMVEQPHHEACGKMAGEVIRHQQEAQWRQLLTQRWLNGQADLPTLPGGSVVILRDDLRGW